MRCRLLLLVALASSVQITSWISAAARAEEDTKPSVTVYPVVTTAGGFTDEHARRVGLVVATLLERSGLEDLKVVDTIFRPPAKGDISEIAEAFGRRVTRDQITTDYAVFAQFVGSPQTGVERIDTVVVDKTGKAALAESAGETQLAAAPLPPKDPMTGCVFVARRLQELWGLQDPLRSDAPEGKMAEFWKEDAGIPPQEELDAITRRTAALKTSIESASCTIYPIQVGNTSSDECAAGLATMLNEAKFCHASTSQLEPGLEIAPHSNEQKVLWDTAKAFRQFVREHPPETDYAVYADYGLFGDKVRYVHVVVCNRSGEWVLIDMQNSHHPLFQQIGPRSCADCNRLLLARLKQWLGE